MPTHATFYIADTAPLTVADIRRLAGDAQVREERAGILRRVQHVIVRWPGESVTLRPMAAKEIPGHLDGFKGFVRARVPGDTTLLEQRVQAVRQVIGATWETGSDADGRAERLIVALAAERRALVVRPDGIFDEHGQPAMAPRAPVPLGEPLVLRSPPADAPGAEDHELPAPTPPDPHRVARRALVLASLVLRGALEDERLGGREALLIQLREAVIRHGFGDEFEPHERALLAAPIGTPSAQEVLDAGWRAEGLAVLGWALSVIALPAHDEMVDVGKVVSALGLMAPRLSEAATQPLLRPMGELMSMSKLLLGLHWRLRDFRVHPRRMDFAAFARKCWFGSFDLHDVPLVDGDLAIDGLALADAGARDIARASSIATERHQASNWLIGDAAMYSAVDVST